MPRRELADVVEFLAALLPAANHLRRGVLQAALGRRHTSRNFVTGFTQGDTAFESVSRSNSMAKNSDDLLAIQLTPAQNIDLQGYLTTDFFKQLAAQAALEKSKIWIAKLTKLVVASLNEEAAYWLHAQNH